MATGLVNAGEIEKLDLLLQAGYDVNRRNDYGVPLIANAFVSCCASPDKKEQIVNKLLDLKADPKSEKNFRYSNGCTHVPPGVHVKIKEDTAMFEYINYLTNDQKYTRYCFQDLGEDPNFITRIPHKLTDYPVTAAMYYLSDWRLMAEADLTNLRTVLDAKLDINRVDTTSKNTVYWTFTLFTTVYCHSPHAFFLFFERKAELGKPHWRGMSFMAAAKMFDNEVALQAYEDWQQMQAEKRIEEVEGASSQLVELQTPMLSSNSSAVQDEQHETEIVMV